MRYLISKHENWRFLTEYQVGHIGRPESCCSGCQLVTEVAIFGSTAMGGS